MTVSSRITILVIFLAAVGCGRKYPEQHQESTVNKEQLVNVNKAVVHDEAKLIADFIARHGWKMQATGTGLRYEVYKKGPGPLASSRAILSIAYKVYLLDGTLCYEADTAHPLKLMTGKGQQINGLEEGLLMLNEGSAARFVIPNHLAYGITGDQDKIPPVSALYYDVQLLKTDTLPQTK